MHLDKTQILKKIPLDKINKCKKCILFSFAGSNPSSSWFYFQFAIIIRAEAQCLSL